MIKSRRDEAENLVQAISAQTVTDDPEEVKRAVTSIRENPQASRIDRAIASAVSLQQQGKKNEAIEKWRAVAHVAEGSDNNQAAKAWFSVGYLSQDLEAKILAYDQAIRLKRDLAEAYYNRGLAKKALGLTDEARKDFETALELARNANNKKITPLAEQALRVLDQDGGS